MDYHYEVSDGNNLIIMCRTLVTYYSVIILCPFVPHAHIYMYTGVRC